MASKEIKIESKKIYDGKIVHLRLDKVKLEKNDLETYREVVDHCPGVCCLIKTKNNKIKFVKQYRYPYNEEIIELPAGKCEAGEDPKDAVIREAEEEVGIKPNKVIEMGYMYPSPGFMNEILYMYYIDDYKESVTNFDEDEDLDQIELTYEEALRMIDNNEIVDGKTICLLLKCKNMF